MSMSEKPADDHLPVPVSPHNKSPRLLFVGVTLAIIALVGGSLLWLLQGSLLRLLHGNTHSSGNVLTATATPTSIPTWSPTEVTPPAESLFYDTFLNNEHGWSLASDGGFFRILVDHMLILSNTHPNATLVEGLPTSVTLDNYVASVNFTINRGSADDSMGLYLRGDSDLDHDYRVDINGNNTIDVVKEWLDTNQDPQTTFLFSPHSDHDLKPPGQQNILTVIMNGSTMVVSVNNLVLITLNDFSYSNGQLALFVHNGMHSDNMIVSFSQVEVDRVASPLQTPAPTPTAQSTVT